MKICSLCKIKKAPSEFNKNKGKKDGLNTVCRECAKERSRKYYRDNTEEHRKNVYSNTKRYREELREFANDLKKKMGCSLCNENEPVCIDFHHLRDKEGLVSNLIGSGSKQKFLKEIDKCVTLCSNCHRKVHAGILTLPS